MPENQSFNFRSRLGKWLHQCFNGINLTLAILAVAQIGVVGILIYYDKIPIPRFVLNKLALSLAEENLYAQWDSIFCDMSGRILVTDLELRQIDNDERILQSEAALVDVNILLLLAGHMRVDSFRLSNAILYCPALYSPSGVNEPIVLNAYADCSRKYYLWQVNQLIFKVNNLKILAHGQYRFLKQIVKDKREPLLHRYSKNARALVNIHPHLDKLRQPMAKVLLKIGDNGLPVADLKFLWDGNADAGNFRYGASLARANDIDLTTFKSNKPVRVTSSFVRFKDKVHIKDFRAEIFNPVLDKESLTLRARMNCAMAETTLFDHYFPGLVGELDTVDYPQIKTAAYSSFKGSPLLLDGDLNLASQSGVLSIEIKTPVANIIAIHPKLQNTGLEQHLDFTGETAIRATIDLTKGYQMGPVTYVINSGPLLFHNIPLNNVYIKGSFNGSQIDIPQLLVNTPDYRVAGSCRVDIDAQTYRFLVRGKFRPSDINPLMNNWWDKVWDDFSFDGELPDCDADVGHSWKDHSFEIFLSAAADNIAYKGARFDHAQASLFSLPNHYIKLYDLEAERQEGPISGSIEWLISQDSIPGYWTKYHFNSAINLPEVALMLEQVSSITKDFVCSAPPRLQLTALTFTSYGKTGIMMRDIQITAQADAPLTYHDLPLDRLDFGAQLDNDRLDVDTLNFGVAGGRGQGHLTVETSYPESPLDFSITVDDANYAQILKVFDFNEGLNTTKHSAQTIDDDSEAGNPPGRFDIRLDAKGILGDFNSFDGKGYVEISDTELSKIQILGGLSRLLDGTWMKFSTLVLDSMHGDFLLHKDRIEFPNLRFSGPTSVIDAKGVATMPSNALDFAVKVFYGRSDRTMLLKKVISPIFKPIGEALELYLWGTLDKPKWRFMLDPRNIFGLPKNSDPSGQGATNLPTATEPGNNPPL